LIPSLLVLFSILNWCISFQLLSRDGLTEGEGLADGEIEELKERLGEKLGLDEIYQLSSSKIPSPVSCNSLSPVSWSK